MGISDFLGDLGVKTSIISTGYNYLQLIVGFLIVSGIVAFITYWYITKKSFNITIEVYEDINRVPVLKFVDKAREITLPNTSTRALQLQKSKIFLPRASLQSGKEKYLFFIRSDGEWVNFQLESINEKLKQMKVFVDHSDMRLANASLKNLVEKNYKKLNWLKEYAPYIGFGILILMLGIAGYLVVGEAGKVAGALSGSGQQLEAGAQAMENTATSFERVAERLDRILIKLEPENNG